MKNPGFLQTVESIQSCKTLEEISSLDRVVSLADELLSRQRTVSVLIAIGLPSVALAAENTANPHCGICFGDSPLGPIATMAADSNLADGAFAVWSAPRSPPLVDGIATLSSPFGAQDILAAAGHAAALSLSRAGGAVILDSEASLAAIRHNLIVRAMGKELKSDAANLLIHLQPQVCLETGIPVGAEALARWSLDGKPVSPLESIASAEKSGLIGETGKIVMMRAARALRECGVNIPSVSVNVSPFNSSRATSFPLRATSSNKRESPLATSKSRSPKPTPAPPPASCLYGPASCPPLAFA